MDYVELTCFVGRKKQLAKEILTGELAIIGFESFVDEENCLKGYIPADDFDFNAIKNLSINDNSDFDIRYSYETIKAQNWNEEWEKHYFEPILVKENCLIRGTFHEDTPKVQYEILIDPKMSFGTGHHETTSLMLEKMLNIDFTGKSVLDMGCGTGVLAILASMRNAEKIYAVDIDEWAFQNATENTALNNAKNIEVACGDIQKLEQRMFDVIIANINRNILLQDIKAYAKHMNENGKLLMSGFYKADIEAIKKEAEKNGFSYISYQEKNKWVCVEFAYKIEKSTID
ncbi:MAG: 50S ribosomal protein L11 methyltransferase [Bacteroidia bacterium]|nr:MAG: 50S ribosomal protein L11 methyltransferase [Bacteroidia bacterium]